MQLKLNLKSCWRFAETTKTTPGKEAIMEISNSIRSTPLPQPAPGQTSRVTPNNRSETRDASEGVKADRAEREHADAAQARRTPEGDRWSPSEELLRRLQEGRRHDPSGTASNPDQGSSDSGDALHSSEGEEAAAGVSPQNPLASELEGFNMEEFTAQIRKTLIDQLTQSVKDAEKRGKEPEATPLDLVDASKWAQDPLLYQVEPETEAAPVPDEWSAENTSQRIVDFALKFASQSDKPFDQFVGEMRAAVQAGFSQAKDEMGGVPSASGKLFNDTYVAAMDKFDKALADWQKQQEPGNAVAQNTYVQMTQQAQASQGTGSRLDLAA